MAKSQRLTETQTTGHEDLPAEWKGRKTLAIFRRHFRRPAYPQAGNVVGNGQLSSYVRGRMVLECNGSTKEPGHLRDFDLGFFRKAGLLPNHVRDKILEWTDGKESVCLYAFFFSPCHNLLIAPVAWVLTDYDGRHVAHWAAKSDSRYQVTAHWLAEQLGWRSGEPWPARPDEGVQKIEEFVENADEETFRELAEL